MLLSEEHQNLILQAIHDAELMTSGEIRVHVESHCSAHPIDRATEVFFQLGMQKTDLQNGVLVYLAIKDRKFSIIGDKGIDAKVPAEFWETIRDEMRAHLKKDEFGAGLAHGVKRTGEVLKTYFPYEKGDVNELSNEISFGI